MARNMPGDDLGALNWLEARIVDWNTNQAGIGLTSGQVIDLAQDIVNTRGAFTSVGTARAASKDATGNFHSNGSAMRTQGSGMISAIKSFAQNSADPQVVYDLASVSPADPRSPAPPPAQPFNLAATLANNGSVIVSWEGTGPVGTLYEVYRRLPAETEFDLLGVVDALSKEYTDGGLPLNSTFATYQVRAVRGDTASAFSTQFNIQFGPVAPPVAGAGEDMGLAA